MKTLVAALALALVVSIQGCAVQQAPRTVYETQKLEEMGRLADQRWKREKDKQGAAVADWRLVPESAYAAALPEQRLINATTGERAPIEIKPQLSPFDVYTRGRAYVRKE
jgi:hypothetical protein